MRTRSRLDWRLFDELREYRRWKAKLKEARAASSRGGQRKDWLSRIASFLLEQCRVVSPAVWRSPSVTPWHFVLSSPGHPASAISTTTAKIEYTGVRVGHVSGITVWRIHILPMVLTTNEITNHNSRNQEAYWDTLDACLPSLWAMETSEVQLAYPETAKRTTSYQQTGS